MSKVVLTRTRTVEEKVVVSVDAAEEEDAVAAAKHQVAGGLVDWKYNKTVETSEPSIQVK